jgi:hypothetical protein
MNHLHQIVFFKAIKEKLSPFISLADEIAQVLKISTDSAYRRIRGEKSLSMEELFQLSSRYQVSLDKLFFNQDNCYSFQGNFVDAARFRFDTYLKGILQQLQYVASFPESHLYYLCKDIPIFYHFQLRDLAAFKYYFWMKTIVNHPAYAGKAFAFGDYSEDLFELGASLLDQYNQFASTEIWNVECINSTLQQIKFYRDTQMFTSEEDIERVFAALTALMRHLEQQAAMGKKWMAPEINATVAAPFYMYQNEFTLGDNSILATTGHTKQAFMVHSVINFMITRDTAFCEHMYTNIQNLMKRSTLISTDSEQERNSFFRQVYRKIEQSKQNLL